MSSRADGKRTRRAAAEYLTLLLGMTAENRERALADLEHRRGPDRVRSRVLLRAVRVAILELADRLGVPRDGRRAAPERYAVASVKVTWRDAGGELRELDVAGVTLDLEARTADLGGLRLEVLGGERELRALLPRASLEPCPLNPRAP
jgi:hypothetical protein